jgi:two-component system OmpR family response regulator
MRFLLVEDDPDYRAELTDYLTSAGLTVEPLGSFDELRALIELPGDKFLLLDLAVGGESAVDFLGEVQGRLNLPCIVVTGNQSETERIASLEIGADDYVLKTASPRELLARVRAVMRRVSEAPSGWQFDSERRELRQPDGTQVALTTAEFGLLEVLLANKGKPVSREVLAEKVHGRALHPLDRAIDNMVVRLRRKLGDDGAGARVIKSVRLVGYVFTGFP